MEFKLFQCIPAFNGIAENICVFDRTLRLEKKKITIKKSIIKNSPCRFSPSFEYKYLYWPETIFVTLKKNAYIKLTRCTNFTPTYL